MINLFFIFVADDDDVGFIRGEETEGLNITLEDQVKNVKRAQEEVEENAKKPINKRLRMSGENSSSESEDERKARSKLGKCVPTKNVTEGSGGGEKKRKGKNGNVYFAEILLYRMTTIS